MRQHSEGLRLESRASRRQGPKECSGRDSSTQVNERQSRIFTEGSPGIQEGSLEQPFKEEEERCSFSYSPLRLHSSTRGGLGLCALASRPPELEGLLCCSVGREKNLSVSPREGRCERACGGRISSESGTRLPKARSSRVGIRGFLHKTEKETREEEERTFLCVLMFLRTSAIGTCLIADLNVTSTGKLYATNFYDH